MAAGTDQLDLGSLALSPGEGRRLDLHLEVDPLTLGGERYAAPHAVPVRLDVSRTMAGFSLRMRAEIPLEGPCMRCLESSGSSVEIDAREVEQSGEDEDLSSPYVEEDELDLRSWARDALALALPAQILCDEACRGLCAVCGENLNAAGPAHDHEPAPDPRWAALRELRLE